MKMNSVSVLPLRGGVMARALGMSVAETDIVLRVPVANSELECQISGFFGYLRHFLSESGRENFGIHHRASSTHLRPQTGVWGAISRRVSES